MDSFITAHIKKIYISPYVAELEEWIKVIVINQYTLPEQRQTTFPQISYRIIDQLLMMTRRDLLVSI